MAKVIRIDPGKKQYDAPEFLRLEEELGGLERLDYFKIVLEENKEKKPEDVVKLSGLKEGDVYKVTKASLESLVEAMEERRKAMTEEAVEKQKKKAERPPIYELPSEKELREMGIEKPEKMPRKWKKKKE